MGADNMAPADDHHSGHGSVMAALAHGVPLLCVPFARDQRNVALHAVATGAAVKLRPTGLSAGKLSRGIKQVLERPEYREEAKRMQSNLASEDGTGKAAEEIAAAAIDLHGKDTEAARHLDGLSARTGLYPFAPNRPSKPRARA